MNSYLKKTFLCLSFFSFAISIAEFPEEIIVIGDSASDSGNSRPQPPGFYWIAETYAPIGSGETAVVYLAEKFGAKRLRPSTQGGTNFSYLGATTINYDNASPIGPLRDVNPSLASQVASLPENLNRKNPVIVQGGFNDFVFLPPLPDNVTNLSGTRVGTQMADVVQSIHDKGFKTIVVSNLPDLAEIPYIVNNGLSSIFGPAAKEFNESLYSKLKEKRLKVFVGDFRSLFKAISDDPEQYGFTTFIGTPPLVTTQVPPGDVTFGGSPIAGYAFWYDGLHPTDSLHIVSADYLYALLSAPKYYAALAELPFGMLREFRTNIRQQLYPVQSRHQLCTFYPFLSGNYTPLLQPPHSDNCHIDGDGWGGDIAAGVTNRISENLTLGVAGGYSDNIFEYSDQGNDYHLSISSGIFSFFAGCVGCNYYLNGIVDFAWLDFRDINRKFFTGPASHKAHAKTKGMDYDAEIYGAYYVVCNPCFRTGPLVQLNYQTVSVDGFTESGSDIGNLEFKKQSNNIFATGLGWEVNFIQTVQCIEFTTDIYVTGNRQWLGETQNLHFREVSLSGVFGTWPISRQKTNFISGGIDVSSAFGCGVTTTLGYNFNVGNHQTSEHFLTLGVNFPFTY